METQRRRKLHQNAEDVFYISASKLVDVLKTGDVAIAASLNIDVNEAIDSSGNSKANNLDLTAPTVSLNAPITLKGDLKVNASNKLIIKDAISTVPGNGNINLNAGNGSLITQEAGTIKAGSGNITLTADPIELGAKIGGSGKITLQPNTENRSIGVGDGANGDFNLNSSDAQLQDGFSSIVIGRDNGNGAVKIGEITFKDAVTIQSPSDNGSIAVRGKITGTDDASISFIAKNVEVGSNITTADGYIDFKESPVTIISDVKFDAGKGEITFGKSLKVGDKELTLIADEIDFTGGANSVTGSNSLVIQPGTKNQDIALANSDKTSALDLTTSDLDALQDGFKSIAIGREDGEGKITVNPFTFKDSVTLQSPQGEIITKGTITGNDDVAITFIAKGVEVAGDITTNGDIDFKDTSVTLKNDVTFNSGKGKISFGKSLKVGEKGLTLTAEEIDFKGGAGSVTGTSKIALQTATPEQDIFIGGTSNSESSLELTKDDIAALENGFESITIKR